ncbi:hypothetical protein E3A20_28960 [Planctomyces bekefii]|uniref:Chemotaxis phosphatase CheX-like domain-containing protein n=1 Tax=Planctomyces bekefii TaxID=1653850 RepID=A0A5C6M1E1_9PLAN|nr:hypothetical protein E3A20_28960 [Planctomyces bekefii]
MFLESIVQALFPHASLSSRFVEFDDVLGEILNQISGGATNLLREIGIVSAIGLPSVLRREAIANFAHPVPGHTICLPFEFGAGNCSIEVCLGDRMAIDPLQEPFEFQIFIVG